MQICPYLILMSTFMLSTMSFGKCHLWLLLKPPMQFLSPSFANLVELFESYDIPVVWDHVNNMIL